MIKEITGLRYRCIAAAQGSWVSHKVNLVLIFKAATSVWVYLPTAAHRGYCQQQLLSCFLIIQSLNLA